MRIIYLNAAYGRLGNGLFNFIESNAHATSAFCFQEVDGGICTKIRKILPGFVLFRLHKDIYNLATFIRKDISPKREKNMLNGDISVGAAEIFSVILGLRNLYISNIHGVSQPGDKKDNPNRIRQVRKIIDSNFGVNGPRIIGGDFNLLPDTQSVKMFEEAGFTNLIRKNRIRSTRNSHAWKQAQELAKKGIPHYGKQSYADYIFVSPEVKVKSFEVLDILISDHLPLILEFEI